MSWTIILPIIMVSVPSSLLGACLLLSNLRRRRTPPELRGDWWSQFEREFRTYVERTASADRPAKFRGRPRGTTGG